MYIILSNLEVCSCRGVPKDKKKLDLRPDIQHLFKDNEIICLQETWFAKQDLKYINNLNKPFQGVGVSTTDYSNGIIHGHPPGGVIIMWDVKLEGYVKPLDLNLDWCVAIEITLGAKKCVIFNVCMPYQCNDNEPVYIEKLGILKAIIDELDNTCYAIVGDWNANLKYIDNSLFANHMLNFCSENNLKISSCVHLPGNSYTYISERWSTNSWLDHIVTSIDFHSCISTIDILYDVSDEDHIPFKVCVNSDRIPNLATSTSNGSTKVRWNCMTDKDVRK